MCVARFVALGCVLGLLAARVATATPLPQCVAGTDHPYSDLPGMPLSLPADAADANTCALLCEANPLCTMFALVPSGCDNAPGPLCYLKSGPPVPQPANECVCLGLKGNGSYPRPLPDSKRFTLSSSTSTFTAVLGSRGLVALQFPPNNELTIQEDTWVLAIDGVVLNSSTLTPTLVSASGADNSVLYSYAIPVTPSLTYTVNVTYDVPPRWSFVRKSLSVSSSTPATPLHVLAVSPFDSLLIVPAAAGVTLNGTLYPSGDMGTYGVFGRLSDGSGVLAAAQNPFLFPSLTPTPPLYPPPSSPSSPSSGMMVHVGYSPLMFWEQTVPWAPTTPPAPFLADAGILTLYPLSDGVVPPLHDDSDSLPAVNRSRSVKAYVGQRGLAALAGVWSHTTDTRNGMMFEYVHLQEGDAYDAVAPASWLNVAERDAFRDVAEAHYMLPPAVPVRVHIPWTENDYQIDIADAAQFPQYQRILTQLSRLGISHILYAGNNSAVSTPANVTDDWHWEVCLWLNEGEAVREGYWTPLSSPVPPSLIALQAVAEDSGVALMPYVYPILGFANSPLASQWRFPPRGYSNLASRAFQDYFINLTIAFHEAMSTGGAGYDYTFFEDGNCTVYAQWAGWRRVLTTLRAQLGAQTPGQAYVVDNRQLNHMWSPWMWAAGSYAEPLQSDENPESWNAFLMDPHTDRLSANRQRQMNYDYAQNKLCPPSALPGFMNHQTERQGAQSLAEQWNVRDYDYYGAAYGIISALGTGGLNAVVCGIPARDEAEFQWFPQSAPATVASVDFYRTWFDWANTNQAYLRRLKFLPVPPGPGVVDGTTAMLNGSSGYIFLYNPNTAMVTTAQGLLTIGWQLDLVCGEGDQFVLGEVWPVQSPAYSLVPCGGAFTVTLEGRSAVILSITKVQQQQQQPRLLLYGRGVRAGSAVEWDEAAATIVVSGLQDATLPSACSTAPAYVLVPTELRHAGVTMMEASLHRPIAFDWVEGEGQEGSTPPSISAACAAVPRHVPPPFVPTGYALAALRVTPQTPTFVHSQAVAGMQYNASFTGGLLSGTVQVPQAVFDQLSARNASYPVPWSSDDLSVAWLGPHRLLLYIDTGGALGQSTIIPATLNGAALPVYPVWSCRSLKSSQCFDGWWVDLTAAGVAPDIPYTLQLKLPAGMKPGVFQGVYYDNVDTVYARMG